MSKRKKKYKPTSKQTSTQSQSVKKEDKQTTQKKTNNKLIAYAVGFFIIFLLLLLWSSPTSMELRKAKASATFFHVFTFVFPLLSSFSIFKNKALFYKILSGTFILTIGFSVFLNLSLYWEAIKGLQSVFLISKNFLAVSVLGLGLPALLFSNKEVKDSTSTLPTKINSIIIYASIIIITIVGTSLYLHRNTHFDVFEDEFQMMAVGKGFKETNKQILWNYAKDEPGKSTYKGVWPHTILLGTSFKIFGDTPAVGRTLSGVLGGIFLISFFFISNYFIKNKWLSLLVVSLIAVHPNFLHLFRYIRMYVIMIPLSQLVFWLLYKAVEEPNPFKFLYKYKFFEWGNYNYLVLLLVLPLLYINFSTHQVSLALVPGIAVYLILSAIIFREQKYYFGIAAIFIGILLVRLILPGLIPTHVMSFFEGRDYNYLEWLGGSPLFFQLNAVIIVLGFVHVLIQKNREQIKKHLFIISLIIFTFIFFIFIAQYAGHDFRFISHVAPWFILMVVTYLFTTIKHQSNRLIATIIILLFLVPKSITVFSKNYERLYEYDHIRPQYSKAYQSLNEKIDIKEETLFGQYFQTYYGGDLLRKGVDFINMKNNKKYTYQEFLKDIATKKKGWVTWATYKGWHIEEQIMNYVRNNFKQYHGYNKDSTGIEVYYFNESMIQGTPEFNNLAQDKFPVNVWFDSSKDFTAHFQFQLVKAKGQAPIIFDSVDSLCSNLYFSEPNDSSMTLNWKFNTTTTAKQIALDIPLNTNINMVLHWNPSGENSTASVYFAGRKWTEIDVPKYLKSEQRLYLPKFFPGQISKAIFYAAPLNELEIFELASGKTIKKEPYRNFTRNQ